MSFWPFTSSLNSNSALQKFLDGIQDFSTIKVQDLIDDANLLQELVNELHHIKGSYNHSNGFQFAQQLQQLQNPLPLGLNFNDSMINDNDSNSITSSSDIIGSHNSKDTRGAKLIELLLQPHILVGLLDYLYNSVQYFHEFAEKENEELIKLLNESEEEAEDDQDTQASKTEEIDDPGKDDSNTNMSIEEDEECDDDDDESSDDKMRRCIQVSADILSVELWVILNRIIETPLVIDRLWLILYLDNLNESSPSVNHLVHILDQLMDTNSIELLNYIRNRKDLVDTFLSKLEVPMLMDFFLRIIQSDKPDSPTGIIDTLYKQDLIPKLINILKPKSTQFEVKGDTIPDHELFFRQTAATDFIKALITISSNTALAVVVDANVGPNQLTRQLVSKDIVNQMVHEIMLYTHKNKKTGLIQTNKHGINNCVGIVIELIRKNNSDYDLNCGSYSSLLQSNNGEATEVNSYVMFQWLKDFEQNCPGPKDPIYLGEMLSIFSDNLVKFCELMDLEPELPPKVSESAGILGFTKFRISELIAELLHCSNMVLINSKKIRKINEIRDMIRDKLSSRLSKALAETLIEEDESSSIKDISQDIGDLSLDDVQLSSSSPELTPQKTDILLNGENQEFSYLVDQLDIEDESDNEEPTISPENPFVCESRDQAIRSNPTVGDYFKIKLVDSNILLNIISKFTNYPWHNFFHNVVFDLIQQIFNGKLNSYNSFLVANLFNEGESNLTKIIINTYKQEYDVRPGYLGHLILISEEVVKFTSLYKPDLISPLIVTSISSEGWNWFVNDILLKTREVYNVVLGSVPIDEIDEDMDNSQNLLDDKNKEEYGFDSSTVGYLDIAGIPNTTKKATESNEGESGYDDEEETNVDEEDEEEEDDDHEKLISTISEVRIQDMSPKPEKITPNDSFDDDEQEVEQFSQDGLLENLSESSSSDEDEAPTSNSNKLTRVKNHGS